MTNKTTDEWFPLVDESGNVIGKATRQQCHNGSMLLHPVVHLHVICNGQLYLQKRSIHKDIQPGKWDTAVGGHVNFGEEIEQALRREAREELGITDFTPIHNFTYVFRSSVERELVYSYRAEYSGVLSPDPGELETGRFWHLHEIVSHIGDDIFTPNFIHEFKLLLPLIQNRPIR